MGTEQIKITINNDVFQFEILECDIINSAEIIKAFPDGINHKGTLTPQLWWGNLDDPKIVILGLNPSCLESDFDDNNNQGFKEILKQNLSYNKRNKKLNLNELFQNQNFKNIKVINTWMVDYNLQIFKDKLNDVAIYNMFGYYQTKLNKRDIKLSHIKGEIKEDIIEKIKRADKVYFLWGGEENRKLWIKLLCENPNNKNDELYDILMNKADAANKKNPLKADFAVLKNS